ncbi:MAG TPA: c-type cytochrome [Burkholderiales bacterium]|nr:c-type cytochrome [Burkholderiales bacterium]
MRRGIAMKRLIVVAAAAAALCSYMTPAVAVDGKAIFTASCSGCHKAMSPKVGDKKAWQPLISKGEPALVASVITGKGVMPKNAGKPGLSKEEIEAAVEYIMSQSK